MAVYRDALGNIDRQEFENHLKAQTRKEGYIEIIMYTPDLSIQVANVTSSDKLSLSNINSITDINKFTSNTIATLEENLWLLNGRFIVYQGGTIDGYISNSVSDENGDFSTNPTIRLDLSHVAPTIENFAVVLNSAVPSGYPKDITVYCYDSSNNLIGQPITENIEWQEPTGEVDENDEPIYQTKLLETLPSVNFNLNKNNVDHIIIECGSTRFRNRRIRISSIMFGKTLVLDQSEIVNVDYTDKTSYVCDTLPSRVFKFDMNNYSGVYNIDNPENGYINLDKNTRVRFRCGYNVYGYVYDQNGHVEMENGFSVIDPNQDGVEIEWDNWKELRLMDVSANADESATFTAGSLLDIMEDTYTADIYPDSPRTLSEISRNVLTFEGLDLNSIEWSSDGIKKPTYEGGQLLPYDQWPDTSYDAYEINTPIPEVPCKQVLQLLAFSVGATILIKDNGHIKFANLDLNDNTTFTNNYEWDYQDFESIPAAEPLENVNNLDEISLPKYYSDLDRSGTETFIDPNTGTIYANCKVVTTVKLTAYDNEVTYSDCYPVGARIPDANSPASIAYYELYGKRGIITLTGIPAGGEIEVEICGYPVNTKQIQERTVTSDSLILDTKIMNYDVNKYTSAGTIPQDGTEMIKRKYLDWYKKKFKYTFSTRGEPLVNAGDYGIIQTQFTEQMPVYILQNHWIFNGAWSGDMEVIALG